MQRKGEETFDSIQKTMFGGLESWDIPEPFPEATRFMSSFSSVIKQNGIMR